MSVLLWVQLACLTALVFVGILYRSELLSFKLFAAMFALPILIWLLSSLVVLVNTGLVLIRHQAMSPTAWSALVMAVMVLVMLVVFIRQATRYPAIHDISSDTNNPPVFTHAPSLRNSSDNPLDYDADVLKQQKEAFPNLAPFNSPLSFTDAISTAQSVAIDQGWSIAYINEETGFIEATARSALLGFVDDIVIRVNDIGEGAVVDIRSASRVGKSDLGANAKRIGEFLSAFEQAASENNR